MRWTDKHVPIGNRHVPYQVRTSVKVLSRRDISLTFCIPLKANSHNNIGWSYIHIFTLWPDVEGGGCYLALKKYGHETPFHNHVQITSCGAHARSKLDDSREIFQKLALEAM